MDSEVRLQLTLLAGKLDIHDQTPISVIIYKAIKEITRLREELKESKELVDFHVNNAKENTGDVKAIRSEFGRIKAKLRELCEECL